MKKIICIFISLLLVSGMMSCNNIQNFPEDTVDDTVESTESERKEEPNNINYGIAFEYETISEFLDFIENMGKPEWYVSPYDFSYIGEPSKVTVYGRFTDNLTFEEFDKKATISYYFDGYEDMFSIEIGKESDIWSPNYAPDGLETEEDGLAYKDYLLHERFFKGIENVTAAIYWYGQLSCLEYIEFEAGNTDVMIYFYHFNEENFDDGSVKEKMKYDMSNEEINKFLYESTLPYALEIMGNVCIYGEEQKYYNIPEEYR